MPIDKSQLDLYFDGKKTHLFYKESVEKAEAFMPHADGTYPEKLIDDRRPNEPIEVKNYRKLIWKPKTKPTFGRIISSLGKIRRSADWSIRYPKKEFTLIREGETLEDYCESNFPYFTSMTNWAFSILLKKILVDTNAVCVVLPLTRDVESTDFLEPYPFIFCAVDVIEIVPEDYVLLNNPEGAQYRSNQGTMMLGKSFYYIDRVVVERWDQINERGDIQVMAAWVHELPEAPFFKLPGVIVKSEGIHSLNASRIEDVLPELDEAVREYSDLQAAKVMNMYPERYEYSQTECPECHGLGMMNNPKWSEGCDCPLQIECNYPGCYRGHIASGPFGKNVFRPAVVLEGQSSMPTPPIGYIQKDNEIIRLMSESVRMHIYDGLSAINFQFLEQSPLNQSGTAKEVDKDELNNTVHAIAEDIVQAVDNIYRLIAFYRYSVQYNKEEIEEMLPTIPVPEKFDILSVSYLAEELAKSKTANMNPAILNAMELEYASKKFNSDHEVRDSLALVLALDPFSNLTEDIKSTRLSNKGILQLDYIISSNIQAFVKQAIEENEKFPGLTATEQQKKMQEYAQKMIDSLDEAKKIADEVNESENNTAPGEEQPDEENEEQNNLNTDGQVQ